MRSYVLGLGYTSCERAAERAEWIKHGIIFEFAESVGQVLEKLCRGNCICVVIKSDQLTYDEVRRIRQVSNVSTVILPPTYTVAEAKLCAQLSAIQYARVSGHADVAVRGGSESLRHGLKFPVENREPLTIVTVKDLSFCLEYRSVEIRGEEIELTEKEFDILALLLSNPKRVFTHEMIMDKVWNEDPSFYSPKAITTHISNLRRKLKIAPDVPEYIKSVRGVGYKFEIPK